MNVVPNEWAGFRLSGSDAESKRNLDEVAPEELGNLALFVLSQEGSTRVGDLQRAVCKLLGVSRLTSDAGTRLSKAFTIGRAAEFMVVENDTASLRRT